MHGLRLGHEILHSLLPVLLRSDILLVEKVVKFLSLVVLAQVLKFDDWHF